jgi:proteasome assembly chaperone (PAC2) family protein
MEWAVKKQEVLKKISKLELGCRSSQDSGGGTVGAAGQMIEGGGIFLLSVS